MIHLYESILVGSKCPSRTNEIAWESMRSHAWFPMDSNNFSMRSHRHTAKPHRVSTKYFMEI